MTVATWFERIHKKKNALEGIRILKCFETDSSDRHENITMLEIVGLNYNNCTTVKMIIFRENVAF